MRRQASTLVEVKGAIGEQQYSNGLSEDKLQVSCQTQYPTTLRIALHEGGVNDQCHSLNISESAGTGSHLSSLFSSKMRACAQ